MDKSKKEGYIVELHKNCWLSGRRGDPGRTLHRSSAKVYKTLHGARVALGKAKAISYRSFSQAQIVVW